VKIQFKYFKQTLSIQISGYSLV